MGQDYMAKVTKTGAQPPAIEKATGPKRKPSAEIPTPSPTADKTTPAKRHPAEELIPALVYMGQVIYRARKEKNLTQFQLAKLAGMNSTSVFMFESGRHNMSIRYIIALAEALDLHLGDLISRNTPSYSSKLKETAEFLNETSNRIGTQLRMMERYAAELNAESEK